jgi:tetratricopeptide (TPR) repeat protein
MDIEQLALPETTSSEAYQAYLKGRYVLNKRAFEEFNTAIAFFEEAIKKEPDYALAYAGLADCYVLLAGGYYCVDEDFQPQETIEKARTAVTEALRLDPDLVEARTTLAWIRFVYDCDWEKAESDFHLAC